MGWFSCLKKPRALFTVRELDAVNKLSTEAATDATGVEGGFDYVAKDNTVYDRRSGLPVPLSTPGGDTPSLPDPVGGGGSLNAINPYSPTWIFVRAWAEEALTKAREKNDSINKDATQTAVLRGEIKILKELINLPNPRKGLLVEE